MAGQYTQTRPSRPCGWMDSTSIPVMPHGLARLLHRNHDISNGAHHMCIGKGDLASPLHRAWQSMAGQYTQTRPSRPCGWMDSTSIPVMPHGLARLLHRNHDISNGAHHMCFLASLLASHRAWQSLARQWNPVRRSHRSGRVDSTPPPVMPHGPIAQHRHLLMHHGHWNTTGGAGHLSIGKRRVASLLHRARQSMAGQYTQTRPSRPCGWMGSTSIPVMPHGLARLSGRVDSTPPPVMPHGPIAQHRHLLMHHGHCNTTGGAGHLSI